MELLNKLEILADAAKYDVSCASSGNDRKGKTGQLGNAVKGGICHSWSDDGRCISLLKILQTNYCIYNCAYCINRASSDVRRTIFSPEEVAELTIGFYRRNYIEGLFLSSAVYKTPDYTMELMIKTVRLLRRQYGFNGYIHMKAIPGADNLLIEEAGRYADRMSINIELPSSNGLKLLAPQKQKEAILKPMGLITSKISQRLEEKRFLKTSPHFVPAGQSTQIIVGATPDPDLNILRLSEGLYKRYKLKRVYYSAYVPVSNHPSLPGITKPPLLREHRLYQADWLLRFYGFSSAELLDDNNPNFSVDLDPKTDWAIRNIHLFPVEINRCEYATLLRIPGIGIRSAQRIASARRVSSLNFESLKKIGVVLKRARHFITCNGKYFGNNALNETLIRNTLALNWRNGSNASSIGDFEQISFFQSGTLLPTLNDKILSLTGEL